MLKTVRAALVALLPLALAAFPVEAQNLQCQVVSGALAFDVGGFRPCTQTTGGEIRVSVISQPGGGLTDTQLRASPVPVSGTVAATQSGTWTVQPGNTANTTPWLVTGTGGTFPVTGTFWQATQPVSLASLPALATGSNVIGAVTQSGTWNVGSITTLPALATGSNVVGKVGLQVQSVDVATTNPVPTQISLPSGSAGGVASSQIIAAASTNLNTLKASAGKVLGWQFGNNNAAWRYVKLFNKASNPTLGTDNPALTIAVPPGGSVTMPVSDIGIAFSTGIALAITTGSALSDTTALSASDIIGMVIWN